LLHRRPRSALRGSPDTGRNQQFNVKTTEQTIETFYAIRLRREEFESFRACRSRRGDKGRNDRKFLEALHYFTVHNVTWRALPAEFGNWNSIWKRFWRLSQAGVFEALFEALAANSQTAHLVQMFDSTTVRAHVSAAGARRDGEKGGPRARPSAARAGASRPRSTSRSISTACRSPST